MVHGNVHCFGPSNRFDNARASVSENAFGSARDIVFVVRVFIFTWLKGRLMWNARYIRGTHSFIRGWNCRGSVERVHSYRGGAGENTIFLIGYCSVRNSDWDVLDANER